ncbi:hypothetical protein GN956_G1039 [Arapaima gigas]
MPQDAALSIPTIAVATTAPIIKCCERPRAGRAARERLYVGRPAQWTPPEYQLQCGGRAPPSGPPADSPAPDDWGGWLQEIASSGLAEWHQRRTWQNEKPKRTDRAKWKSAEKVGRTEREEQTKGGKGQAEEC